MKASSVKLSFDVNWFLQEVEWPKYWIIDTSDIRQIWSASNLVYMSFILRMFEVNQGKIRFDRSKLMGQGGFARVYEGVWNGKQVAVKQVQLYERLENGDKDHVLSRFDHPNVIKMLHAESDRNFR